MPSRDRPGALARLWMMPLVGLVLGAGLALGVVLLSDLDAAPATMRDALVWLNEWIRSPGFGTLAAVVAAVFAFTGVWVSVAVQRENASRDRWWDQVKWACERLGRSDFEQATAIMVLSHFAGTAPGQEEADFVADLMVLVMESGDDDVGAPSAPLDDAPNARQTRSTGIEDG